MKNNILIARSDSNWDYYTKIWSDGKIGVMAIAKQGTGCNDCYFGDIRYFKNWLKSDYCDGVKLTKDGLQLIA